MTAPADREFRTFSRGQIRDLMLEYFAQGLKLLVNPETGSLFTEDEIAAAVAPGSRWWRQAQAEDDYAQGEQRRALYMNDQIRIDRASTAWLAEYHAQQWDPDGRLVATPSSGLARVTAPAGTIIIGSSTIGDDSAYWGRDELGNRFQVFTTVTIPSGHTYLDVIMSCMDPGSAGNRPANTVITWQNFDPGMSPTATVETLGITGGTDIESDAKWASRMLSSIRWKQAAGNDAQFRAWARECLNAIEDGFVYACALNANSVVICITQERSTSIGPLARIPSAGTLTQAVAYLTPPGSTVVPTPPLVLVVRPQSQPANVGIRIDMAAGSLNGWTDPVPFPSYSATACAQINSVSTSSFIFQTYADAYLPRQTTHTIVTGNCPNMLAWDAASSSFVDLSNLVTSIQDLGTTPPTYQVNLSTSLPSNVVAGAVISPAFANFSLVSAALEQYFDARGPGELFLSTDDRSDRCVRFPERTDEYPPTIGADMATTVIDALEGQTINATVPPETLPVTAPYYAGASTSGPYMLTLGKVGIYPL